MPTFGQQLVKAMDAREVSVRELAKSLDVHEKTIYRWRVSPSGPNLAVCYRIAGALGIDIRDLKPDRRNPKAEWPRTAPMKLRVLEGGNANQTKG